MQHIVYLFLWALSIFSFFYGGTVPRLFEHLFPFGHFAELAPALKWLFIVLACATLIHQGFIYHYFHSMEKNPADWKIKYPGWFGTRIETGLRAASFIFVLIVAGEIEPVKKIMGGHFKTVYSDDQYIIVFGSAIFFTLGLIWDISAGFVCKKWGDPEHTEFMLGDFLAFLIWLIIGLAILFGNDDMGPWALIPVGVAIIYILMIGKRLINLFSKEQKPAITSQTDENTS